MKEAVCRPLDSGVFLQGLACNRAHLSGAAPDFLLADHSFRSAMQMHEAVDLIDGYHISQIAEYEDFYLALHRQIKD
ncbi:MAG: hypothetical protein R3C11_22025 [Planctomycetaceae bacterium]